MLVARSEIRSLGVAGILQPSSTDDEGIACLVYDTAVCVGGHECVRGQAGVGVDQGGRTSSGLAA